jgi:hypothetical protein
MSINDYGTDEIRIRQDHLFIQSPNNTQAGEDLSAGQFAQLGADAEYYAVGAGEFASHLIIRSAKKKDPADWGTIDEGDPVIAITGGPGIVTIPVRSTVTAGQKLTTNANGYAVAWSDDTSGTAAHIVGEALADVTTLEDGIGWVDVLLNLPSSVISTTTTSETTKG